MFKMYLHLLVSVVRRWRNYDHFILVCGHQHENRSIPCGVELEGAETNIGIELYTSGSAKRAPDPLSALLRYARVYDAAISAYGRYI